MCAASPGGILAKLVQLASYVTFAPLHNQGGLEVGSNLVGWQDISPTQPPPSACTWTGVICDPLGVPRSLNLSSLNTNQTMSCMP